MRKKTQIMLAVTGAILIIGLLYLSFAGKKGRKEIAVYVAAAEINKGEEINTGNIEIRKIPIGSLDNYVDNKDLIVGKFSNRNIAEGDLIFPGDIADENISNVYPVIEPGKRMYSVLLRPEYANGMWIQEGKRVDIYVKIHEGYNRAYFTEDEEGGIVSDNEKIVVLEDIKILRIMDETGCPVSTPYYGPGIICFELSEEEIKLLAYYMRSGEITLAAINE